MNTETFESFVNEFLEIDDNVSEGGDPNIFQRLGRKVQKLGRQTFSPEGVITIVFTTTAALKPITKIPGAEDDTMDKIRTLLDNKDERDNLLTQFQSGQSSYVINKRVLYKYIVGKSYSMLSGETQALSTEAVKEEIRKVRSDLFDDVFGPRLANFKKLDISRKIKFLSQTIGVIQNEQANIRDPELKTQLDEFKKFLDSKLSPTSGSDQAIVFGGALPNKITFEKPVSWNNDQSMHEALNKINANTLVKLENIKFDKILVLKEQKDGKAVLVKLF